MVADVAGDENETAHLVIGSDTKLAIEKCDIHTSGLGRAIIGKAAF
jgi:hypothetical protein